jgi:hypothetical protein
MVTANKNLIRIVRRLAAQEEIRAMRLRGRLVVPVLAAPVSRRRFSKKP